MSKLSALAVLAMLALPGAASAATITNEYVFHQYDPSEVRAMTQGQDFRVVVIGNPTTASQSAFEARLMQLLQHDLQGLQTHPTTTPIASNNWGYRLVLMFNTDSGELGRTLCGDLAGVKTFPATGGGEMKVSAALCRGKDPMSAAFARSDGASLEDASAGQMFSELTSVLFPNRPGLLINRNIPF